jgi:hypothetical protein
MAMKRTAILLFSMALTVVGTTGADREQTFTGVITDSMCGVNHQPMNVAPDAKCVRECVKANPAGVKFALNDGRNVYKLSDQATPAPFAGQKVRVTGTLFAKTAIIQVSRIELAR